MFAAMEKETYTSLIPEKGELEYLKISRQAFNHRILLQLEVTVLAMDETNKTYYAVTVDSCWHYPIKVNSGNTITGKVIFLTETNFDNPFDAYFWLLENVKEGEMR